MHIDLQTLMAMESFVSACAGVVLLFAWWRDRGAHALAIWAGSNFAAAGGILSIALGHAIGNPALPALGGALLALAPALVWKAARTVDGKPAPLIVVVLGLIVFLLASAIPGQERAAAALSLAAGALYFLAAAHTFWRGHSDPIGGRAPLTALTGAYALVLTVGSIDTVEGATASYAIPPLYSLFGLVHVLSTLFPLATAVFLLALVDRRREAVIRTAAQTDGLTGIANRAAFMDRAAEAVARARNDRLPVAMVMFDLDRFKSINDTHGHAAGDDVIRRFCEIAARELRPQDVLGRIGGEEFAMAMPGAGRVEALAQAERVRTAFAQQCRTLGERAINATVSGGVCVSEGGALALSALLEGADAALYRAKASGRNRIECADAANAALRVA